MIMIYHLTQSTNSEIIHVMIKIYEEDSVCLSGCLSGCLSVHPLTPVWKVIYIYIDINVVLPSSLNLG